MPATKPEIQQASGKAILFARRDIIISADFAEKSLAHALESPWPSLADVSTAGTPVEAGRPILTIFAHGETVDQVERNLHQRVTELEEEIYASA